MILSSTPIPKVIWFIALSNFFMNISSVMSFTYLPIYLTTVLGVTMASLGIIEGIIDSSDLFVRVISGYFSDKIKKRKIFIGSGFIFATISRFLLAFSSSLGMVMIARMIDRISHGFQASPRDALMGDLSPSSIKAKCYSIRYIFTVAGNAVGALISIGIMLCITNFYQDITNPYQGIFLLSSLPAILACIIFLFFVKDTPPRVIHSENLIINLKVIKLFSKDYWILILSNFLFMTAAFGCSFLIKSAEETGLPVEWLPLVMIIKNTVIVISSLIFGNIADKFDKKLFVKIGLLLLIASHFTLSFSTNYLITFLGISLAGIQWGILYGSLCALVTEYSPPHCKGVAFGIFHFTSGIAVLLGNILMGYLWNYSGSSRAFLYTSIGAFLSIGCLIFLNRKKTIDTHSDVL